MPPVSRSLQFTPLAECSPLLPPEEFLAALKHEGLQLSGAALSQMTQFVQLFLAANQVTNLSALRTAEAVWLGLVLDSLRVMPELARLGADSRVVDVGCGGGFPGIPLAIAFPNLKFSLVDATAKKMAFVRHAVSELGLIHVEPVLGRAEELTAGGQTNGPLREQFDLVTARAVAALPLLLEFTAPFARPPNDTGAGGVLVLIKGEKADDELAEAKRAIGLLTVRHTGTRVTPSSRLLSFEKLKPTDARFPRPNGAPKRKPLL